MKQKPKNYSSYTNSPEFLEFVSREFDSTAKNATIEKFSEFAFGGMEAAIKAFEEHKELAKGKTFPS